MKCKMSFNGFSHSHFFYFILFSLFLCERVLICEVYYFIKSIKGFKLNVCLHMGNLTLWGFSGSKISFLGYTAMVNFISFMKITVLYARFSCWVKISCPCFIIAFIEKGDCHEILNLVGASATDVCLLMQIRSYGLWVNGRLVGFCRAWNFNYFIG